MKTFFLRKIILVLFLGFCSPIFAQNIADFATKPHFQIDASVGIKVRKISFEKLNSSLVNHGFAPLPENITTIGIEENLIFRNRFVLGLSAGFTNFPTSNNSQSLELKSRFTEGNILLGYNVFQSQKLNFIPFLGFGGASVYLDVKDKKASNNFDDLLALQNRSVNIRQSYGQFQIGFRLNYLVNIGKVTFSSGFTNCCCNEKPAKFMTQRFLPVSLTFSYLKQISQPNTTSSILSNTRNEGTTNVSNAPTDQISGFSFTLAVGFGHRMYKRLTQ